jgi:hypothetical protein
MSFLFGGSRRGGGASAAPMAAQGSQGLDPADVSAVDAAEAKESRLAEEALENAKRGEMDDMTALFFGVSDWRPSDTISSPYDTLLCSPTLLASLAALS